MIRKGRALTLLLFSINRFMNSDIRRYLTLVENSTTPLIVVDVQPEYSSHIRFAPKLMSFINQHKGPVLMFINAEETQVSNDTRSDCVEYWLDNGLDEEKLYQLRVVDKGYGHFRAWMDFVSEETIVRVARFMIENRIEDSRDIEMETGTTLEQLMGADYNPDCEHDPLFLNWVDFDLLRQMRGAMLCGGGRDECLAEVRIMLDILDIPHTLLSEFIYG